MAADLSSIIYFLPLLAFLIVTLVVFVVIKATKVIESQWIQVFVALAIAAVFVSAAGPRTFILSIIPWFAVTIVSLFLIIVLFGTVGFTDWNKGMGRAFGIVLLIIFVISAFFVFSSYLNNPTTASVVNWAKAPRVAGGLLLIVVSAAIAWFLGKKDSGSGGKK